jgi:uncharacterized protein (DUF1697 family)
MNSYIALFRGINVGGNNILPMKELAGILEDLGCEKVKTYIQSGNVVFQSKKEQPHELAGEITAKILEHYGFEPKVILLEKSDLQDAIENNPFATDDGKALHFFFLASRPEKADLERLMALKSASEAYKLHKKVFYLYTPDGLGRSKLATKVEQCLGIPATARNWNTVSKLLSLIFDA